MGWFVYVFPGLKQASAVGVLLLFLGRGFLMSRKRQQSLNFLVHACDGGGGICVAVYKRCLKPMSRIPNAPVLN